MSDGTVLNPSTLGGGDKIDDEDLGARGKVQRVKLVLGAIGVDGGDVAGANPLPVTGAITATCSGTVAVSSVGGTVAVSAASLPLPAGAAQEHTTAASPHAVRLSTGAAFIDPTQVRALTSADVVTANVGTTGGLALDATLTGGAQKAITRGGAKGTTTAADVTSAAVDANTQALHTSVTNFPATQAISATALPLPSGAATDATATRALRGATDARKLIDYDVRTDSAPVYVGVNTQAALVADATWTVLKLFYDASNRLVDAQSAQAIAWTARTTYAWRSSGGN